MAFFIFSKEQNNKLGTLYRIAENENDLNNLNIIKSDYFIKEISQNDFDNVRLVSKNCLGYNNETVIYEDATNLYSKTIFQKDVGYFKQFILDFLNNNKKHPDFNKWNSYLTQLNDINFDSIQFPLSKSIPQYFQDLGLISLNNLQLP